MFNSVNAENVHTIVYVLYSCPSVRPCVHVSQDLANFQEMKLTLKRLVYSEHIGIT